MPQDASPSNAPVPPAPDRPATGQPAPGARPRFWPALVIVGLLGTTYLVTRLNEDTFGFMQSFISMSLCGLAVILLSVWFLFFSRLPQMTKVVGVGAFLATLALPATLLRHDGWDGQMGPIFAWRWTPTASERFAARQEPHAAPEITTGDDGSSAETFSEADAFPEFLGPGRLGRITGLKLSRDWNAQPPREIWRRDVGLGWGSFVVSGGLAVTQEQRDKQEAVVAYELRSGREAWVHLDTTQFFENASGSGKLGGDGPRATPTIRDGRVYSLGATGLLNCLELKSGTRIWQRDILKDAGAQNIVWGMSGSPLLVDGKVIVIPGTEGAAKDQSPSGVAAYDAASGEKIWCSGSDKASYASPQFAEFDGVPQALIFNAPGIAAHDIATGRELWREPWTNDPGILCAQPLVLADWGYQPERRLVLVSSGYGVGSILLEIKKDGDAWSAARVWRKPCAALKSKFTNLVVRDGHVFGLDEGILVCVDLADGRRVWKGGRYKHGQMLLVDDLLLIQAEDGFLALVEASPQSFQEVARYPALNDRTWNNLCLSGRLLLTRNDREAVCLELPVAGRSSATAAMGEEGR